MERSVRAVPNRMSSRTDQMGVAAFPPAGDGHGWMGKAVVR